MSVRNCMPSKVMRFTPSYARSRASTKGGANGSDVKHAPAGCDKFIVVVAFCSGVKNNDAAFEFSLVDALDHVACSRPSG